MGNANKSLYSKQQLLYYHLNKREYAKIEEILKKYPECLNKPITKDSKQTLLMRAAFSANIQSVKFILSCGADPNVVTTKGQSALTIAIQKNQIEIVDLLIQKGADVNVINPANGLKPIDIAILPGFMDITKILYHKMNPKDLRQSFQYEQLGKKYQYRYVNYKSFLKLLTSEQGVQLEAQNNYLKKEKVQMYDPVPDPRESWKQWFKRNVDFKDAPVIERSSLPPELQPQNRKLGKVDVFLHNWTKSDAQKKISYKPKEGREVMSEMNDLIEQGQRKQGIKDYQSAV